MTETYYGILGLDRNCSAKEVRDAFVHMSKLHHPDRHSNNSASHTKFVKINEAYSVLSKPGLRRSYDSTLVAADKRVRDVPYTYQYRRPWESPHEEEPDPTFVWRDETIERGKRERAKARDGKFYNRHDSYYGVKGFPKKPNSWIAGASFVLMGIGIVFHYLAFKYSTTFNMAQISRQQELYYKALDNSREAARIHGNESQLRTLEEKIKETDGKPF